MSLALDWQFTGTAGAAFTGDTDYTVVVGSPTYATAAYGKTAVHFPAAAQTVITEATAFSTTTRFFSVIHKISGVIGANQEVLQTRVGTGRGPGMGFSTTGAPLFFKTSAASQSSTIGAAPVDGTEFRTEFLVDNGSLTITLYPTATSTTPIGTQTIADSTTSTITNVRHGFTSSAGFGAGVTLDVSWPRDETTTTSPGARSYLVETLPTTDSGGTYTNWTSTGANDFSVLADSLDTTYIESVTNPTSATFTVPLPSRAVPSDLTSVQLLVRAELAAGATSGTLAASLYQNTTSISTGTPVSITSSYVDYLFNLTGTQAAAITASAGQWANLNIRVTTTAS